MKRNIIITIIVVFVAIFYFSSFWIPAPAFKNEKFIVIEKGDYSYFIRHLPAGDTTVFIDTLNSLKHTIIVSPKCDTLYAVLDQLSYLYNKHKEQDQFFRSYKEGDTIVIKSIKKKKFWTKLSTGK